MSKKQKEWQDRIDIQKQRSNQYLNMLKRRGQTEEGMDESQFMSRNCRKMLHPSHSPILSVYTAGTTLPIP